MSDFEAFFKNWKFFLNKIRVDLVFLEESFDTKSKKSPMGERV